MLRIALDAEAGFGSALMTRWGGEGAARVLAQEGNAILLERATGNILLAQLARNGGDVEAIRIICAVTAKLHAPRSRAFPRLMPLSQCFPGARTRGRNLRRHTLACG
jgi:streptomycin 6-kinase